MNLCEKIGPPNRQSNAMLSASVEISRAITLVRPMEHGELQSVASVLNGLSAEALALVSGH